MEAKIEKISELSKLLSVKSRMSDDLFHLFGKFGIGHLLSRLSLEKHDGVSASELILSLCLFRILGESIHSICKRKIYELSNHGKNCFYRMMIRPQMDWRRLMNHFALRYLSTQYKEHFSDYRQWEQLSHAGDWLLFDENLGESLSIDETCLSSGEVYTFLTNKAGKGGRGTLVAVVRGTKAEDVIRVLEIHSSSAEEWQ